MATIDADGYMQITDRAKDVIKSGGEWISSNDLENAATRHPAVAEVAVIGVPHEKWQERPLLVVVRKAGRTASKAELRDFLAEWGATGGCRATWISSTNCRTLPLENCRR